MEIYQLVFLTLFTATLLGIGFLVGEAYDK